LKEGRKTLPDYHAISSQDFSDNETATEIVSSWIYSEIQMWLRSVRLLHKEMLN